MRLSNIRIENYRGIMDLQEIPLSSFTSIVGKNDTGKSIILNAIATFLDIKNFPVVESDFNNPSNPIIIDCHFTDDNLRDILENKIKSKIKKNDGLDEFLNDLIHDNSVIVRKTITQVGKKIENEEVLLKVFNNPDFNTLYTKSDDELNEILLKYHITIPVSGVGRNSKLEKISHIKQYCRDNSIPVINTTISDDYKICSLLPLVELFVSDYGLKADTTFKTNSVSEIIEYFDRESADDTKKLKIAENEIQAEMNIEADEIKTFMLDYVSTIKKIEITPTIVWKDAVKSVDVNFQFEGDSKPIPMSHKGTGYRRLFMVARFRYLAQKSKGNNVIYLIEEPETYLHPSAQEDLLNSFLDLVDENQIIITTHSPVFAGSTNYDSVILCQRTDQSKYESVGTNKESFIKKIVSELGIKPAYNLRDNFEKILFVEGKGDRIFFDIVCNKVLNVSLIDNEKILVLPFGGGEDIDSFINIEYFSKSQRDLFLIVDSDKHQNNQVKQQNRVNEFVLKERSKGYMLKKSCIENYYHPRAFERHYSLSNGIMSYFGDSDKVKDKIKQFVQVNHLHNIKEKNNFDVYRETTKDEWLEILEPELIDFLTDLIS